MTQPTFEFNALEPFGMEVAGLDLREQLPATTLRALAEAFVTHKLLLFRGQSLEPAQYSAFAHHWGKPRIDGFTERNVPGFSEISQVGNYGGILEQQAYQNGAAFWHTDCAAEPDPNASTMLYCVHAPDEGGETVIADMQAAYDALDAGTKSRIETVEVWHCYSGTRPIIGGKEEWEYELETVTDETANMLPAPVKRPLVRPHSVTRRKGLYSPAGSIFAVEALPEAEAHELLRELKLHAIKDQFCYRHRYRRGDLLMWDNTSTMHCAQPVTRADGRSGKRLLYRIAPLGLPAVLQA